MVKRKRNSWIKGNNGSSIENRKKMKRIKESETQLQQYKEDLNVIFNESNDKVIFFFIKSSPLVMISGSKLERRATCRCKAPLFII